MSHVNIKELVSKEIEKRNLNTQRVRDAVYELGTKLKPLEEMNCEISWDNFSVVITMWSKKILIECTNTENGMVHYTIRGKEHIRVTNSLDQCLKIISKTLVRERMV